MLESLDFSAILSWTSIVAVVASLFAAVAGVLAAHKHQKAAIDEAERAVSAALDVRSMQMDLQDAKLILTNTLLRLSKSESDKSDLKQAVEKEIVATIEMLDETISEVKEIDKDEIKVIARSVEHRMRLSRIQQSVARILERANETARIEV